MGSPAAETLDNAIPGGAQALLQGAFVAMMAYGIEFTLYAMACSLLWKSRNQVNNSRNMFFVYYTSSIFILSSLYIVGLLVFTKNVVFGNYSWMIHRTELPAAIVLTNDAMVVKGWLCTIVNIWRCIVIYKSCRVPSWLVNLIPGLLYLFIVALGFYSLVANLPIAVLNIFFPSLLDSVFFIVSLTLNILVTILLVLRLLFFRHRIVQLLGRAQGAQYTGLATMIAESALIHSSVAIPVIIMRSLPNVMGPGEIFLLLLSPLQGISTFLIILRVAQNKAWSRDNYENTLRLSSLKFTTRVCDEARSSFSSDATSTARYGHERCGGARMFEPASVTSVSPVYTCGVEKVDYSTKPLPLIPDVSGMSCNRIASKGNVILSGSILY